MSTLQKANRQSLWTRVTNPKFIMVYATIGIFLLIYLFGAIAYGEVGFTTLRTFTTLFVDNAYYGISAIGMTLVLITGGIDLSVGAVASLTGMLIAYGTTVMGIHPLICMAFALFVGVGLGLLMGWVIHYLNVPPFITTLTGMFLARGVCSLISRESIEIRHPLIDDLASWKVFIMQLKDGEWVKVKPSAYINLNVIVFIIMLLIGIYLLQRTRFGRNVYAIGGSEQSARLMGLPVGRTKVLVYGFNGLCSVLAGITYALYVKSGWNLSLQGAELDVITCAVIGGTLLTGGVGYMIGTLFGVMLKAPIPALITFNGNLLSWWGKIATGLLLLLFICIQKIVVRTTDHRKKKRKEPVKG